MQLLPSGRRVSPRWVAGVTIRIVTGTLAIAGAWLLLQKWASYQDWQRERDLIEHYRPNVRDIDGQIAAAETILIRLQSPEAIDLQKHNVAVLYEIAGNQAAKDDLAKAEFSFKEAATFEPLNPRYRRDIAQLYSNAANREAGRDTKLQLLENSATNWEMAVRYEKETGREVAYRDAVATTRLAAAKLLQGIPGKAEDARKELERAKEFALPGSRVFQDVSATLASFNN